MRLIRAAVRAAHTVLFDILAAEMSALRYSTVFALLSISVGPEHGGESLEGDDALLKTRILAGWRVAESRLT